MAIGKITLEIFKHLIPLIRSKPIELVSMGYPDCLVPTSMVRDFFGADAVSNLKFREDSHRIIAWHSMQDHLDQVIETFSLFKAMGMRMTVLDINTVRGDEIICDLNEPIPDSLAGKFDIVLDGGTLEHCFNVGQAVKNFVAMLKVNGYVVHGNPLFALNHGFFNFCPTFYYDFYRDNAHKLMGPIYGYVQRGLDYDAIELPPTDRFPKAAVNSWLSVVAQKLHDRPNVWPTQTKYKKNPTLGG